MAISKVCSVCCCESLKRIAYEDEKRRSTESSTLLAHRVSPSVTRRNSVTAESTANLVEIREPSNLESSPQSAWNRDVAQDSEAETSSFTDNNVSPYIMNISEATMDH